METVLLTAVGVGGATAIGALIGFFIKKIPHRFEDIVLGFAAGISRGRTLVIALCTGLFEVLGTLIGYLAVGISAAALPFTLAAAGGTMLYVISDEMIPETHAHGFEKGATYSLILGFCVMLLLDGLLS